MIEIISQWVLPVMISVAIAVIVHQLVFFTVLVSSHSMEPTLVPGDRLLMARIHGRHRVKRQDIIAFYSREYSRVMIKRVIGLPGDLVTIQNGRGSINGEEFQEAYVQSSSSRSGTYNVPQHQFMLLGDHRKYSTDSRSWVYPFITEKDILGRVVFRLYPLRRIKYLGNDNRKK